MKKVYIDIHKALHNKSQKTIKIGDAQFSIQTRVDGLRFVIYEDKDGQFEIIEQNPNTRSIFADRARNGEKISWLIPMYYGYRTNKGWQVIDSRTQGV